MTANSASGGDNVDYGTSNPKGRHKRPRGNMHEPHAEMDDVSNADICLISNSNIADNNN